MAVTEIEYLLQSHDANWNTGRWKTIPRDGCRYEVIDGRLYMTTAPSHTHQRVVVRLVKHVGIPLEDAGIAIPLTAPIAVLMPEGIAVQPDFCLVRTERESLLAEDGRVHGVPDLVVGVLSVSHPQLDWPIKRAAYTRTGVPEYWIFRPDTRDIMLYWQPEPDFGDFAHSMLVPADGVLESPTLPIIQRIADFFAGSPDKGRRPQSRPA